MSNANREYKVRNARIAISRLSSQAANDIYDRLAAHITVRNKEKGASAYTISGCEPNAGATTIANNLSFALASTNFRIVFVNADIKKGPTPNELKSKAEAGLTHYLSNKATLEDIICDTNYDHLKYIACGEKAKNSVELLYSQNMDTLIKDLKKQFDVIIIDTPSVNAAVDASIIASKTDMTILVARYNTTRTSDILNAKKELEAVDANLLGIVLNNVHKLVYRNYQRRFGYIRSKA